MTDAKVMEWEDLKDALLVLLVRSGSEFTPLKTLTSAVRQDVGYVRQALGALEDKRIVRRPVSAREDEMDLYRLTKAGFTGWERVRQAKAFVLSIKSKH